MSIHNNKILFATGNPLKKQEVEDILEPLGMQLLSFEDMNFTGHVPETSGTIEGNANQKAEFSFERWGIPTLAEDTGLIVPSIGGLPGVDTAVFSGPQRSDNDNMAKLLELLDAKEDRTAYFLTVMVYRDNFDLKQFTGRLWGRIDTEQRGSGGFGYDPIFIPDGYSCSLAELGSSEKNKISHRYKACIKFLSYQLKK